MTGMLDLGSNWGPFSSNYLGISHILNRQTGSMADMALLIGRKNPECVIIPDSAFDHVQGVHDGNRRTPALAIPEAVTPDYQSYRIRYLLDPSGDTAVAEFVVEDPLRARATITFQNKSTEARQYFYQMGLSASDTQKKVFLKSDFQQKWIAARNYAEIDAYQKSFALGCRQCLTRSFSWGIEEEVLGQAFGGWPDDRVTYRTRISSPLQNGILYFHYIKYSDRTDRWEIRVNGQPHIFLFPQSWAIPGGGWGKNRDTYEEWKWLRVDVGPVNSGDVSLELRCLDAPGNDTGRIWLDGMVLTDSPLSEDKSLLGDAQLLEDSLTEDSAVSLATADESSAIFNFTLAQEPSRQLKVTWDQAPPRIHQGQGSLVCYWRKQWQMPEARALRDSRISPWCLLKSPVITVPAGSECTISLQLDWSSNAPTPPINLPKKPPVNLEGPYAEVMERLADIVLFNVNYPLKLGAIPSPYYVPAKYFPVPYSWDGGLIAVGLATFAPDLAWQQAAYFMADSGYNVPFIYAGSPVPTALYAVWDAYQKTQSIEDLKRVYSGSKRMYDFYLGRTPGSLVNIYQDGALSTYAYNYNLGLDDHPIQRWAEQQNLTSKGLCSILLMAQILRIAQIMRNIATLLHKDEDAEVYTADIALLTEVIEEKMWDDESGVYGWLFRDGNALKPVVFAGSAGDPTICGFLPLFAGQLRHKERLVERLMNPERFVTRYGISTVDRLAPCYNPHGYTNGGVWPIVQWYLWRGLLEAGEPELAKQITLRILNGWEDYFQAEKYIGEFITVEDQIMSGAPNFSGLSSILLPMRAAYFEKYCVTPCYDVMLLEKTVEPQSDRLSLCIRAPFLNRTNHLLLANMGSGDTSYELWINDHLQDTVRSDSSGHLSLVLPAPVSEDKIVLQPEGKV